jgi:hypothetical protein
MSMRRRVNLQPALFGSSVSFPKLIDTQEKCKEIIIRFPTLMSSSLRRMTPNKEHVHTLLAIRHPLTPSNVFSATKLFLPTPIDTQKKVRDFDFGMTTPGAPLKK